MTPDDLNRIAAIPAEKVLRRLLDFAQVETWEELEPLLLVGSRDIRAWEGLSKRLTQAEARAEAAEKDRDHLLEEPAEAFNSEIRSRYARERNATITRLTQELEEAREKLIRMGPPVTLTATQVGMLLDAADKADTIVTLRTQNQQMREALETIAGTENECVNEWADGVRCADLDPLPKRPCDYCIARTALNPSPSTEGGAE